MSKPRVAALRACCAVRATPTTPPAGPDSTASRPLKAPALTSPPAEVMNHRGAPSSARTSRST